MLLTKEPTLQRVILDQGGALWFGALARLDIIRGPSIGLITFMSNEVSLVRNTIAKANLNYLKSFGTELYPTYSSSPKDTSFIKHSVKLKLKLKGTMNQEEIAIHGLGTIAFRQLEHTNVDGMTLELELFLPLGVGFSIRPSLIGIQEALSAKTVVRKPRKGNQSGIN